MYLNGTGSNIYISINLQTLLLRRIDHVTQHTSRHESKVTPYPSRLPLHTRDSEETNIQKRVI